MPHPFAGENKLEIWRKKAFHTIFNVYCQCMAMIRLSLWPCKCQLMMSCYFFRWTHGSTLVTNWWGGTFSIWATNQCGPINEDIVVVFCHCVLIPCLWLIDNSYPGLIKIEKVSFYIGYSPTYSPIYLHIH